MVEAICEACAQIHLLLGGETKFSCIKNVSYAFCNACGAYCKNKKGAARHKESDLKSSLHSCTKTAPFEVAVQMESAICSSGGPGGPSYDGKLQVSYTGGPHGALALCE